MLAVDTSIAGRIVFRSRPKTFFGFTMWLDSNAVILCPPVREGRTSKKIYFSSVFGAIPKPDTTDSSFMMEWVSQRKNQMEKEMLRQGLEAWKSCERPGKELDIFKFGHHIVSNGLKADYQQFEGEFIGLHLDTRRGPIVKVASRVACWFAYARQRLHWDV